MRTIPKYFVPVALAASAIACGCSAKDEPSAQETPVCSAKAVAHAQELSWEKAKGLVGKPALMCSVNEFSKAVDMSQAYKGSPLDESEAKALSYDQPLPKGYSIESDGETHYFLVDGAWYKVRSAVEARNA